MSGALLPHADAADLVLTVRRSLVEVLAPHLPDAQRYEALMAAHALGIAVRALASADTAAGAALSRTFWLVGGVRAGDDPRRALVRAIRRGDFDEGGARRAERGRLFEHLQASIMDRLAVDNPKLIGGGAA